jgi:hypothetical protein
MSYFYGAQFRFFLFPKSGRGIDVCTGQHITNVSEVTTKHNTIKTGLLLVKQAKPE